MYLTPFATIFPTQGQQETRVITTRGYPGLPDDEYALVEAYCADPKCDCRRVMLNVLGRHQGDRYLAAVGFGFDRDSVLAGPYLDPLNRQSQYAGTLFSLVEQILDNPDYVARLQSHYGQVKRASADPRDPAYEIIREIRLIQQGSPGSPGRPAAAARRPAASARKKKRRQR